MNFTTRITSYETVGDHTEYIIQVSCSGIVWPISRRFSDFDQLNARIRQKYGVISAQLPEKQWFGRFDKDFLQKRQQQLQVYLEKLLNLADILENRAFQHFLEIDRNVDVSSEGALYSLAGDDQRKNEEDADAEVERMVAIVDSAAQAFIDVTQAFEHLEPEQILQRQNEILTACQGFQQQKISFDRVSSMQLPVSAIKNKNTIVSVLSNPLDIEKDSQLINQCAEKVKMQLQNDVSFQSPTNSLVVSLADKLVKA